MGDPGDKKIPADFTQNPDTSLEARSDVWRQGKELEVSSHRPLFGFFIVLFKKLVRKLVKPALADLFELQKSFNTVLIHNIKATRERPVRNQMPMPAKVNLNIRSNVASRGSSSCRWLGVIVPSSRFSVSRFCS